MKPPPLPDWVLYGAAVAMILFVAENRQEKANAPAPPPPPPGEEAVPADSALNFNPAGLVRAPAHWSQRSGTAFSVADRGVWITARHVVEACRRAVVMVADNKGVAADIRIDPKADLAILKTQGGTAGLTLAAANTTPRPASRGFFPGYPQGQVGEATARYIGKTTLRAHRRTESSQPVMAWAETGRTESLDGSLAGLSGSPVLDASGAVIGVTLAEAPRRGRIYTARRIDLSNALAMAGVQPSSALTDAVTIENYGRVADGLRRDLRVARVVCLSR